MTISSGTVAQRPRAVVVCGVRLEQRRVQTTVRRETYTFLRPHQVIGPADERPTLCLLSRPILLREGSGPVQKGCRVFPSHEVHRDSCCGDIVKHGCLSKRSVSSCVLLDWDILLPTSVRGFFGMDSKSMSALFSNTNRQGGCFLLILASWNRCSLLLLLRQHLSV